MALKVGSIREAYDHYAWRRLCDRLPKLRGRGIACVKLCVSVDVVRDVALVLLIGGVLTRWPFLYRVGAALLTAQFSTSLK